MLLVVSLLWALLVAGVVRYVVRHEVNELMDNREIIRDKILVIMRRQFAANHPIQQVFDNPSWTGKVLINSMIDFSDVSNWI